MNTIYIVSFLLACVFGLTFWLARKYKREGVLETEKSVLEQNIEAVENANAIDNKIANMSDDAIADELRSRTR